MIPAESCTTALFRRLAEGMLRVRPPAFVSGPLASHGIDARASHAQRRGILWCSVVTALSRHLLRRPKCDQSATLLGAELRTEASPVRHQSGGLSHRPTETVPERRSRTP